MIWHHRNLLQYPLFLEVRNNRTQYMFETLDLPRVELDIGRR